MMFLHLTALVALLAIVTSSPTRPIQAHGAAFGEANTLIENILKNQEKITRDNAELRRELEEEKKKTQALTEDILRLKEQRQDTNVAFYVHLQDGNYEVPEGSIIQYSFVVSNLGEGYNSASASFTAPLNGYYIFPIFYQTIFQVDSDLGIMVNDIMVCRGNGSGDDNNQATCTAVVELEEGDVVNVKAVYGGVTLNGAVDGRINGFTGFLYSSV